MRPIHVWRSRTPDGVWCAHFPSVVTTIMYYKVQLINPLNLGELYAAYQNLILNAAYRYPLGLKRIFQFSRKCENHAKMGWFSRNFMKFRLAKISRKFPMHGVCGVHRWALSPTSVTSNIGLSLYRTVRADTVFWKLVITEHP
jgi:hypothetical protein